MRNGSAGDNVQLYVYTKPVEVFRYQKTF